MAITIETGMPRPAHQASYPWNELKVGDSFFFSHVKVKSAAIARGIAYNEHYSTRKVEGGYRVWRVK